MRAPSLHFLGTRRRGCSGGRHRNAAAVAAASPVGAAGVFVGGAMGKGGKSEPQTRPWKRGSGGQEEHQKYRLDEGNT